jgi:cytochrome c oxidase subunit 2
MQEYLGLPPLASAHGGEIDHMIGIVHWLMLVLFVGWGIFFVYSIFRFRKAKNVRADYKGVKSHLSSYLELGVALLEGVLIVAFAVPIWANRVNAFPPENDATVVRVVAQQFAWNIHYPGPDGRFGRTELSLVNEETNPLGLDRTDPSAKDDIVTNNQLHLPVDKPVIVYLSSTEVVHSLRIPVRRIKQEVIPGQVIPVWFVPTKTGEYEIACAQLCGLGHYRMRGYLTIQTKEEFDAWLKEQASFLQEETASSEEPATEQPTAAQPATEEHVHQH